MAQIDKNIPADKFSSVDFYNNGIKLGVKTNVDGELVSRNIYLRNADVDTLVDKYVAANYDASNNLDTETSYTNASSSTKKSTSSSEDDIIEDAVY